MLGRGEDLNRHGRDNQRKSVCFFRGGYGVKAFSVDCKEGVGRFSVAD